MAKYIGTYATSGDVQTALDNNELSRPFIAYTTDNDKVYYGAAADRAEAGDIVVYSTADDLLHYIKQADYNTTSYPAASYVPVGVVAYPQTDDAILGPTGEITFTALKTASKDSPDSGSTSSIGTSAEWGYTNFDIPELTNFSTSGTAITDMNGKANTEAVLQYATGQTDWRTASAITWSDAAGYYPIFECAWRYHTSGTVQGDWYVPSYGQFYLILSNPDTYLTALQNGLQKVNGVNFPGTNANILTSTEMSAREFCYFANGRFSGNSKKYAPYTRLFCSKLLTRI